MRRIIEGLRPHKKLAAWALGWTLVTSALAQVNPLVFRILIDSALGLLQQGAPIDAIVLVVLIWTAVIVAKEFAAQGLLAYVGLIGEKLKVLVGTEMSNSACEHLASLDLDFFEREENAPGKLAPRIDKGIEGVSKVTKNLVVDILPLGITSVLSIILMFLSNWMVGLLTALIVPVFFAASWRQASENKGTRDRIQGLKEQRSGLVVSFVESVALVKAYLMERRQLGQIRNVNSELTLKEVSHHKVNKKWDAVKRFCENIGEVAVLGMTTYLVAIGQMTIGAILLHLLLYRNISAPISHLHRIFDEYQEAMAFARGYFDLLDQEATVLEPDQPHSLDSVKGDLSVESISFSYIKGKQVLKSVSMDLERGKTYALVGVNGAGKSTITKLMTRFYDPQSGRVMLDGVDIRNLRKSDVRRFIGVVMQKSHVLDGSIRDNLAYTTPHTRDDRLWEVLQSVGLEQEVRQIGIDAPAKSLSGGQQQRLAIARVLIKNPPILVFDEPTSSIDTLAAEQIDNVFRTLMSGRTTLVISHNMSLILEAHRIFVLKEGNIVEQGTHDQLYAKTGHYRVLMDAYLATLKLHKFSNQTR
jgi:ABC-type multidrug transport system fused ATPase/permease subunit